MTSKTNYTESDVRAAYTKLRELTNGSDAPDAKRADIVKQVKIIGDQIFQKEEDELSLDGLQRRADMALTEGHVDLFEKVCDWCKLGRAKAKSEMGPWYQCYEWLRNVVQYRAGHSVQLSTRLANSKQYFKSVELYLSIESEQNVTSSIKNTILMCDTAPAAIGTGRGLYPLILEIYNKAKY